ncbi:MAG: EMC3/TMCO1 family protein [Candidatus Diapherotrites archaeon]
MSFYIVSPMADIAIYAFILACVSQWLQYKFFDRKGQISRQKEMKEKQKELNELLKKGDPESQKKAEAAQKEMMELLSKSMSGMPKQMIISMVIFLPPFAVIGWLYGEIIINLPFAIPWFDGWTSTTNWVGWYVLCSLVFAIVLGMIIGQIEKRKEEK